jgi:prepilin-type N-terminal cleavage/methylation domain-containing protein
MTPRARGGFTLVELIVVTVLGSLVLMAALQVLITNQRTYTQQNAAIQGQQSTRMALDLLFSELREASPAGGDLLTMTSDSVRVRLMRKFGIVCEVDLVVPTLKVLNGTGGERFDSVGERVFLFADNYENDDDDDVWIDATVTASDTMETCFAGAEPATELLFAGDIVELQTDSVRLGAPIRSYETYTFGPTTLLGVPYLGRRDGNVWIPIAGPIRPGPDGLDFEYRDAMGVVTAVPTDVRQIVVKVRTGARVLSAGAGTVRDSITAWIYTRN